MHKDSIQATDMKHLVTAVDRCKKIRKSFLDTMLLGIDGQEDLELLSSLHRRLVAEATALHEAVALFVACVEQLAPNEQAASFGETSDNGVAAAIIDG